MLVITPQHKQTNKNASKLYLRNNQITSYLYRISSERIDPIKAPLQMLTKANDPEFKASLWPRSYENCLKWQLGSHDSPCWVSTRKLVT